MYSPSAHYHSEGEVEMAREITGRERRSVEVERNMPARAPRLPATMMNGRPDALNKRRPLVEVAGWDGLGGVFY